MKNRKRTSGIARTSSSSDTAPCSELEYKSALIRRYSVLKNDLNDYSSKKEFAEIIARMIQLDKVTGMDMWANCVSSNFYESWMTDTLLGEIHDVMNRDYSDITCLFTGKDNATKKVNMEVFSMHTPLNNFVNSFPYFVGMVIKGLILQNDVFLANELLELAFSNPNMKQQCFYNLVQDAIPKTVVQFRTRFHGTMSDAAYNMFMYWIEQMHVDEEAIAILKLKMTDHLIVLENGTQL